MVADAVRLVAACWLAACCVAVAGCSSAVQVDPDGVRVRVTAEQLQRRIDGAGGFPVRSSLRVLGSIQVDSARLMLMPEENAIGLSMPLKVALLGRSWSGTVEFSASPGYDRKTGTIFLQAFTLRDVQAAGLPQDIVNICAALVSEVLRDSVKRIDVYTLDGSKSDERAARLFLKDIEVQPDAVAFHLGL